MIEKLVLEDNYTEHILNILQQKTDQQEGLPIVLYGTGNIASVLTGFLKRFGFEPSAYVVSDNHYDLPINQSKEYPVIKYSQLEEYFCSCIIMIATDHLPDSYIDQIKRKWPYVLQLAMPIYDALTLEYIKKNEQDFDTVYNLLSDQISQDTFVGYLNACLNGDRKYLLKNYVKTSYFIDEMELNPNEIFVDAGAYNGDTFADFIASTQGKFGFYYGFEPDESNWFQLCEKTQVYRNTKIFKMGLYKQKDRLMFKQTQGISSNFCNDGNIEVFVDSIDNLCQDATFIKMDIEGAEMEALYGAVSVIQKNKPKLAICIYHKVEDLTQILKYLKSLVPEYKFLMRQHNHQSATDLVLYALTDE